MEETSRPRLTSFAPSRTVSHSFLKIRSYFSNSVQVRNRRKLIFCFSVLLCDRLFVFLLIEGADDGGETNKNEGDEGDQNRPERPRLAVAIPGLAGLPRFDPSAVKLRKSDEAAAEREKKRRAAKNANDASPESPNKNKKQRSPRSPRSPSSNKTEDDEKGEGQKQGKDCIIS